MASASNDFAGTGALSASYTILDGSLSRDADELVGGDSQYNIAWINGVAFANDHWSEIIVDDYGADGYGVVAVRCSGLEATGTCYFWTFTATAGGNADLFRRVNGVDTKVVNTAESFGVPAVGQRARLRVEGQGSSTVVRAYINDVEIFSYTDTSGEEIESGAPGFGAFRTSSRIASWEAGDDVGEGSAPLAPLAYYRNLLGG